MTTKRLTSLFLLTILMFLSGNSYSQREDSTKLDYQQGLSIELYNQKSYGIALGGILSKNVGNKNQPNIVVGAFADVIMGDSLIFAPRLKFTNNYVGIFGFGLNFAANYCRGEMDFRITPEVNISLYGIANIYAGFSINMNDNEFSDLSKFRIGISLNLVNDRR